MPRDYGAYANPGVFVEEVPGPLVTSPLFSPTVLALVGDSQGYRDHIETIQLFATPATQLVQEGVAPATIEVKSALTGVTYTGPASFATFPAVGTDYTVNEVSAALGTYSIERVAGGAIADGDFVNVSYQFTDTDYHDVLRWNDFDDIKEHYGAPFDSSGGINSELSLAALLAFRNGATSLVTVAVDRAGASPVNAEWQTAIDKLVSEQDVNVIVPVSGVAAINTMVRNHVNQMAALGLLRLAFVGLDGTPIATSTVDTDDLVVEASGHDSTRIAVVGPAAARYDTGSEVVELGGQYIAAAVAGRFAFQPPQEPLTRKRIEGFRSIPNQASESTLLNAQRNGVMVVFEDRRGQHVVRHGVTSKQDPTVYTREVSVQASRDRLRDLIQNTLQSSELIGGINTSQTPDQVLGVVSGALEFAKNVVLISDYADLKWRIPSGAPTTVEVRFQYQPSLPLNYISVVFSINTQSGDVAFSSEQPVPA